MVRMLRTNIHLDTDQRALLRALAESKGVCVAELIRRAIERYLDTEERRRKTDAK